MKRHPFTSHPHDGNCWRCGKGPEDKRHTRKPVLIKLSERGIKCLNGDCGRYLRGSKTPARDFLVGPYSLSPREDWCRFCHSPFTYRRAISRKGQFLEMKLREDHETGRLPTIIGERL